MGEGVENPATYTTSQEVIPDEFPHLRVDQKEIVLLCHHCSRLVPSKTFSTCCSSGEYCYQRSGVS